MYGAFVFIGVLFGVALSITLGLFYVLAQGGSFKESFKALCVEWHGRLTGRHRLMRGAVATQQAGDELRLRSLQDELRMVNRMLAEERSGREEQAADLARRADQAKQFAKVLAEREKQIRMLQAQSKEHQPQLQALQRELATREAELGKRSREIRDLQVELDVLGAGVSLVSGR